MIAFIEMFSSIVVKRSKALLDPVLILDIVRNLWDCSLRQPSKAPSNELLQKSIQIPARIQIGY